MSTWKKALASIGLSRRAICALCSMDVVVDVHAWEELLIQSFIDNEHKLTTIGYKARERLNRLGFHITTATSPHPIWLEMCARREN